MLALRAVAIAMMLLVGAAKGVAMEPRIIDVKPFFLAGIETRTSNALEMSGKGKIGALWSRFYCEKILDHIPGPSEPGTILSVYTDYENEANGEYTVLVGAKVDSPVELPPGFSLKQIPGGRSAVLTSERGPIPDIVIALWKRVWTLPPDSPAAKRAFRADIEVYDGRAADPRNAQIDLLLSIR